MKVNEIQVSYKATSKQDRVKITNSITAKELLMDNWDMDKIELVEEFKILLLNRANEVIGIHTLSKGGNSACIVDLKVLFGIILKSLASSVILVHNHPSGNLKPSEADKSICKKVQDGAKLFDLKVLDNMIITVDSYYSFADEGTL